jgi:predicted ATPase
MVIRIGDERYRLLEPLREYALDRLRSRGELAPMRERHATYYSRLLEDLDPAGSTRLLVPVRASRAPRMMETLDEAQDNVHAALQWWLETEHATEGLVLVRGLGHLWAIQGVPPDGRRWVEAMFDLAERTSEVVPPALRAQALLFGGIFARIQGDFTRARAHHETGVAIWRTLDDDLRLSQGLANLGADQLSMGELEQAGASLSESLALARAASQPFTTCLVLLQLGTLARLRSEYGPAVAKYGDACNIPPSPELPRSSSS